MLGPIQRWFHKSPIARDVERSRFLLDGGARVESLESRQMLAGSVTFNVNGGNNLSVRGSNEADCVNIVDFGDTLFVNGQNVGIATSQLEKLTVNTRGGSDQVQLFGITNDLRLNGSSGSDILIGNIGDDDIRSGGDADHVEGGDGDDTVRGGGGDDVIRGGRGADLLVGGGGTDIFVIQGDPVDGAYGANSDLQFNSTGQLQIDTIRGFSDRRDILLLRDMRTVNAGSINYERQTGEVILSDIVDPNQTFVIAQLRRNLDLSVINQGDGNWTLLGSASPGGRDMNEDMANLVARGMTDIFFGGTQAEVVTPGDGSDFINAGLGDDFIAAGNGNDIVRGGDGDDVLRGGRGADILIGGKDADVFVISGDPVDGAFGADSDLFFDSTGDLITDVVIDFDDSEDILVLQDFNVVGTGVVSYNPDTGNVILSAFGDFFVIATLSTDLDISVINQGDGNWTLL